MTARQDTYELMRDLGARGLRTLKIGDMALVTYGWVKRKDHNTYVLFANYNHTRARWGTLTQIKQDVRFLAETGRLPVAQL